MEKDYLSRKAYIDLLKNIIENQKNKKSGYSFAIDGEWGSGKTWVLKELEKQLLDEKDNNYLIFHYNAWENDFYDEPLIALLSVMIETLKLQKQGIKESGSVGRAINTSITALTKVAGSVIEKKYSINPSDIIDSIKESGKTIADIKLTKSDFNKMLPLEDALKTIQDVIVKLSNKKNLILIIDELDRCLPEYAIKVLERLHHICNEQPIIQILAINKKDLAFGITKAFGMNDPETRREKFAEKYLQKFVQIFIPLDNGNISDEDNFLNIIEGEYVTEITIDKAYVLEFYKKLMRGINPRTQEYVCNQVNLVHKLTILSGNKMEQYSYGLLCCELMYCIKYSVIREKTEFRISKENDNIFSLDPNISTFNRNEIIYQSLFESNIDSIFRNQYEYVEESQYGPRAQDKEISGFSCANGSGQLLNYFVNHYYIATKWPQVIMMDNLFNPERKFLKEFIKILEKL